MFYFILIKITYYDKFVTNTNKTQLDEVSSNEM